VIGFPLSVLLPVWVALRIGGDDPWVTTGLDIAIAAALLQAALAFSRDDPPRLGWMLAFAAQAFATISHVLTGHEWASSMAGLADPLTIVLNVCWVGSIVVFIRNVAASGLTAPWTAMARALVGLAALAAGATAYAGLTEMTSGSDAPTGVVLASNAVSTVSDALVFVGAVVLVRMVLPMSGGTIARPYFLLAASAGAYLLVDAGMAFSSIDDYTAVSGNIEALLALADGALLAAGLTQLKALE
jgi:hypothetical protein